MNLAILILAAGTSSRMGGADKLLMPVGGKPLLRRIGERALAAGVPVAVTLPVPGRARRKALEGLEVRKIDVPDAAEGMAASIRRGAEALMDFDALMIQPADMPALTAEDFRAVIAAFDSDPDRPILRATASDGQHGHPVLIPQRFFKELAALSGDEGARSLLKANAGAVTALPLPGRNAVIDLDTPGDWESFRPT